MRYVKRGGHHYAVCPQIVDEISVEPGIFHFDSDLKKELDLNVALEAMLIFNSAPDCFDREGHFRSISIPSFNKLFDVEIDGRLTNEETWDLIKKTLITYCHEKEASCYILQKYAIRPG